MWCEYCEISTPSTKTTIRITSDGQEILVKDCEFCGRRTEIEYFKGTTVRVSNDKPARKRKKRRKQASRHS